MATKLFSCFVDGLEAHRIEVEVDILQGLPGLSIVGLGDAAVQEAKERIRSAIKNSGATYPQQKKIINLAPAHLRKNGACFDVPMALGLLAASGQIKISDQAIMVGELALNGEVRPISGALSIAMFAQRNGMQLFLPAANAFEASLINYPQIYPVQHLSELIQHCRGTKKLMALAARNARSPKSTSSSHESVSGHQPSTAHPPPDLDMNMIQGQLQAKRALEIAAAGGHHLLFYGPPGTGKTLLAQALQGILPPLNDQEMLEVMQIYSAAGLTCAGLSSPGLTGASDGRPFRRIHQSCSLPALIGGGTHAQPGEISLAHHGVLFFDEIAEAPRRLLESLRQPLEERRITVSRLHHHVVYPANFTLVAAMNPCPCGYYGSREKPCTCGNSAIVMYHKKLSGPILDRFDLFMQLQRQPIQLHAAEGKSSHEFQASIIKARQIQARRFPRSSQLNSQMKPAQIQEFCIMDTQTENLSMDYANKSKISARSFHNVLRLARTIADLNDHPTIAYEDAMEAFNYRLQPTSPLI